jgi:hypothetical protein
VRTNRGITRLPARDVLTAGKRAGWAITQPRLNDLLQGKIKELRQLNCPRSANNLWGTRRRRSVGDMTNLLGRVAAEGGPTAPRNQYAPIRVGGGVDESKSAVPRRPVAPTTASYFAVH